MDRLKKRRLEYFPFGFQISDKTWMKYEIDGLLELAGKTGGLSDSFAVRLLADRINEIRSDKNENLSPVLAGHLMAIGLIQDIMRFVINTYCEDEYPNSIDKGLADIKKQKGYPTINKTLKSFIRLFPPLPVKKAETSLPKFIDTVFKKTQSRDIAVHEVIVLFFAANNPAFKPYLEIFDDTDLKGQAPYIPFIDHLEKYFQSQPPVSALGLTLFEALRAPILECPDSIDDQLDFLLRKWGHLLPSYFVEQLLTSKSILLEENRGRGHVVSTSEVITFDKKRDIDGFYPEMERYSQDKDWMSNVVLIAKSTYVWLDQLSKKYSRSITRLDQIPDEELDNLAKWGFTSLWLIGLWERSPASQKIKHIMGNPEAVSSAYSLFDYEIAYDIGGEEAYQNLNHRAQQRGIRLASDMVPNHVGLYSRWIIEHPDWFISSEYPPFPGYQFTGPDLSLDSSVSLYIEDGYWSHQDAAVVFKRVDNTHGAVRYIYHGNDGTHMPWNDTAQLNYLNPEVREAVIQTIIHVARKFPIIRFDAAMTLAKKHFQRLWFPQPGDGGAIPSRAECGMTRSDFDSHIPEEFWREVVDRIAAEVPETLLMAEAFWLMEGYFVRTLGMHRVYNSAFMNMLKMEENSKYRTTIKNVLEFSPEIIKRFVNFMNNPDEKTAVEQFGKGDKYFGVAVMMATMPGLPMFGHGQIEGLTEKYGMEYRKAYWDEEPDPDMMERHEREIFPLLRKRYLFSGSENFTLFDFYVSEGHVNENVFAFTNKVGSERALVLYNNAYDSTSGWIRGSTRINTGRGSETNFITRTLAEALALNTSDGVFYIFRDHRKDLEFIRNGRELNDMGLYAEFPGYEYSVLLDFREVRDTDGSWSDLAAGLGGRGVPDMEFSFREQKLAPMLNAFGNLLESFPTVEDTLNRDDEKRNAEYVEILEKFSAKIDAFLGAASDTGMLKDKTGDLKKQITEGIDSLLPGNEPQDDEEEDDSAWAENLNELLDQPPEEKKNEQEEYVDKWNGQMRERLLVCSILEPFRSGISGSISDWMDEWLLPSAIVERLIRLGCEHQIAWDNVNIIKAMLDFQDIFAAAPRTNLAEAVERMLRCPYLRDTLMVNTYQNAVWFNQERYEGVVFNLYLACSSFKPSIENSDSTENEIDFPRRHIKIFMAAANGGCQVEKTLEMLRNKEIDET